MIQTKFCLEKTINLNKTLKFKLHENVDFMYFVSYGVFNAAKIMLKNEAKKMLKM